MRGDPVRRLPVARPARHLLIRKGWLRGCRAEAEVRDFKLVRTAAASVAAIYENAIGLQQDRKCPLVVGRERAWLESLITEERDGLSQVWNAIIQLQSRHSIGRRLEDVALFQAQDTPAAHSSETVWPGPRLRGRRRARRARVRVHADPSPRAPRETPEDTPSWPRPAPRPSWPAPASRFLAGSPDAAFLRSAARRPGAAKSSPP